MDDAALQDLKHKATIAMSAERDTSCTTARVVAEGAYFVAHAAMMQATTDVEVERLQAAFQGSMRALRSSMYVAGR